MFGEELYCPLNLKNKEMKTLKSLLIVAAVVLATGSALATGKAPDTSNEISKTVREKIAEVIQSAEFQGKGMVFVKFSVNEKNLLKIIKVESSSSALSSTVNEALALANIKFPEGSKGVYQLKVYVNETAETFSPDMVRQQVINALDNVKPSKSALVDLKIRVTDSSNSLNVLKADSKNPELAAMVKKAIEERSVILPKALNGDYSLKIRFE